MTTNTNTSTPFSTRFLSESAIRMRHRAFVALAGLMSLVAAGVMWTILRDPAHSSWLALIIWRGGLSFIVAGFSFLLFYNAMCCQYEWLDESQCGKLADLCEEHPWLGQYRDRVRAAGRRFTVGELGAMRAWVDNEKRRAQQAKCRADCRRLYGLSSLESVRLSEEA